MNAMRLQAALCQLYKDVTYAIEDGTLPESALNHTSMVEAREALEEYDSKYYDELMNTLKPLMEVKRVGDLTLEYEMSKGDYYVQKHGYLWDLVVEDRLPDQLKTLINKESV